MVAALVITGCEPSVTGTGVAADHQNDDGVSLALLGPGNYPTTTVPLQLTPSAGTGVVLEGQRMADGVVVPSEVDAALRELVVFNTGAVESAQALSADIGLSRANIVAGHHFVAGFSTYRSTGGGSMSDTSLVNLVMRFADQSAAAAAARALVDTDMTLRRTAIPRHADTPALAFTMAQGVI